MPPEIRTLLDALKQTTFLECRNETDSQTAPSHKTLKIERDLDGYNQIIVAFAKTSEGAFTCIEV